MIIGLVSQKGGVGKTTLSLNLAGAFAAEGRRVLVLDVDPQQNTLKWASRRQQSAFNVSTIAGSERVMAQEITRFARDYDITIVDTPPIKGGVALATIRASDLVVIPIKPGALDLWATMETIEQVRDHRSARPELQATFVINMKDRSAISRDIGKVLAQFDDVPIQPTEVWERRGPFNNAITFGETVVDQQQKRNQARDEIVALAKNLIGEQA